jgi:hypothetical protein
LAQVIREAVEVACALSDRFDVGVEQERVDFDARISEESIADEAVFPTRFGINDEDVDEFLTACDGETLLIVLGIEFARVDRQREMETVIALVL